MKLNLNLEVIETHEILELPLSNFELSKFIENLIFHHSILEEYNNTSDFIIIDN